MKKLSLVLALLVVCSVAATAASTTYSFTLRDTSGNPYCNAAFVHWYSPGAGIPKVFVGGYYYSAECDGNFYTAGGFKVALPTTVQYAGSTTPVLPLNSPAYWSYTGNAFQLLVNPTYHTWTIYWDTDFYGNYLVNYGTWVNGTAAQAKAQVGTKDSTKR